MVLANVGRTVAHKRFNTQNESQRATCWKWPVSGPWHEQLSVKHKSVDGNLKYTRRCHTNTQNKQVALKHLLSLCTKDIRHVSKWRDGIED